MADVPDQLTLKRHRDLVARKDVHFRRVGVGVLALFLALGLANLFGQRPQTVRVAAPAATLSVYAPMRLRSGLIFQARFHITARRELKKATLVLDSGWLEGITVNEIEPSPLGQASQDGKLVLSLGHVPAGKSFILFLQGSVNPTNVGHRSQDVELLDDTTSIATVHRSITVFP